MEWFDLLRCYELLAIGCYVSADEIRVGILVPNPISPPTCEAPQTLYDATTEPPTPYLIYLPTIPLDRASYRVHLSRIRHESSI